MLLKKIRLENIRSYIDEEIEFPTGSILLSGNIGCGKSTILQAIDFALFGITQELTGSSLLRNGEDRGGVELHFEVDNKNVVIKRSLKRGTSVVQDAGYIIVNNARREATATELKQSILTLLNYPEELLTKSKSLIYRYTVYTPQEEMKSILHGDKEHRLDTLRRVFGIDKYKRLKENAELVVVSIKSKNKENAIMIADLEQKKTEQNQLKMQLKSVRIVIESILPKLSEYHLLLEDKKKKVELINKEIKEQQEIKKKLEVCELSIRHKTEEAARNLARIGEIVAIVKDAEVALEKEKPPAVSREKIMVKEKEIITKEAEIRILLNNIQEKKTHKAHAEKIMGDITKLENCPICKRKVTKEHQETVTREERQKIMRHEEEMRKIQKQVLEKEEFIKADKLLLEQDKKAEQFIALYELKKRNIEEKKKETLRLQEINTMLAKEKEMLELQRQQVLQQIKKDGAEDVHEQLRLEVDELQERKKKVEIEKATNEREVEHLEKQISALETDIKKKEKIRDNIGYLKEVQFWLENMFMNLMNTMEKKIMLKVHSDFSTFFKKWFETLVDTEAIKVTLDDEFSPIIEQNGHEINYSYLSGGEKTAAALAYRLALNQVINSIMSIIRTKELIILDEPTDGFSSEQIDRLRLILEELKTKQIIIVSHENKIESFVQHVIKIEKNDHISAVASQ